MNDNYYYQILIIKSAKAQIYGTAKRYEIKVNLYVIRLKLQWIINTSVLMATLKIKIVITPDLLIGVFP